MKQKDERIVMTLDAGGRTLRFTAIRDGEQIVEPLSLPTHGKNLDRCMKNIEKGFREVAKKLPKGAKASAISFAFPGPADYPNGVIYGFLPNFPAFREGVALGPWLSEKFGMPAYINNDADLFTWGEATRGVLPWINRAMEKAGNGRRFRNLVGYTIGSGFGVGIFSGGRPHMGDNACVETFCLRHRNMPAVMLEDGVSIRAVQRLYRELTGQEHTFEPHEISQIARGKMKGDRQAALRSFEELGQVAGDAIATAVTLIDAPVVLGGGLTGSADLFMPALLAEMRSSLNMLTGEILPRIPMKVYNLDDKTELAEFARGEMREIEIYGMKKTTPFDPQKRIGIATSKLDTTKAIWLGAYSYAIDRLDSEALSGARKDR